MIKGISSINSLVKTGVIAALLAGSTAIYASNPITKDAKPNQTEVVSKEGAAALRAMNVQTVQQNSVPTVHNAKLDRALRKYIESNDDKEYVESIINNVYKENGTFMGSALMQHEINMQQLFSFMSGNTDILIKNNINPELGKTIKEFGPVFYKTVSPIEEKVSNWVLDKYTPALMNNLQFDHKPNAEEICTRLDIFAKERANFDQDNIAEYYAFSNSFIKGRLNMRKDTQAMSDLIAYKMFLIDKILFKKELSNVGTFRAVGRFEKDGKTIRDYYDMWIKSVEPNAK